MYAKQKPKILVKNAKVSTRCQKEHTRLMDVLIHSDEWSLFIMAIVKQNIFTEMNEIVDT